MTITNNPWKSLSMRDGIIAECDELFFASQKVTPHQYASMINNSNPKTKTELTFDCLPEPYSGNPESKVYCLNKNPGEPDKCFDGDMEFARAMIDNMLLKSPDCFWAEGIKNKCGKQHGGVDWLVKRTQKLEEILDRHPNIFFVEYFPYHSKEGFAFPECLPSYKFSDDLIYQAMKEEKLIIIMREKKNWLKRIKGLGSYPLLYTLKNAQGGYLTPTNIIDNKEISITNNVINYYF